MKQILPPEEGYTVWDVVADELAARRWTRDDLLFRMGGDRNVTDCALDLLEGQRGIGPGLLLGEEIAQQLGFAFGVEPRFFLNMDLAWRIKFS